MISEYPMSHSIKLHAVKSIIIGFRSLPLVTERMNLPVTMDSFPEPATPSKEWANPRGYVGTHAHIPANYDDNGDTGGNWVRNDRAAGQ